MIGDDIAGALSELRAHAESLMVTPCSLERMDGHSIDPETGERTDTWAEYWAGGCKLETSREAQEVNIGGQLVTAKPANCGIPWDAPVPQVDDRLVTPIATFHVVGVGHHSSPIMRRFTAVENQG